jgi:hypothetical protein
MGVSGQRHAPAALYSQGKNPRYPLNRRLNPRAGLDAEARRKILCLCRGSKPGRPVRNQTLYRIKFDYIPHKAFLKCKSNVANNRVGLLVAIRPIKDILKFSRAPPKQIMKLLIM